MEKKKDVEVVEGAVAAADCAANDKVRSCQIMASG